jgi:hypothetical protein
VQAWSSDKLQDDWESERVDDSVQNGSHAAHLRETGGIGSSVVASTIGCTRQRCRPEFSFTLGHWHALKLLADPRFYLVWGLCFGRMLFRQMSPPRFVAQLALVLLPPLRCPPAFF